MTRSYLWFEMNCVSVLKDISKERGEPFLSLLSKCIDQLLFVEKGIVGVLTNIWTFVRKATYMNTTDKQFMQLVQEIGKKKQQQQLTPPIYVLVNLATVHSSS